MCSIVLYSLIHFPSVSTSVAPDVETFEKFIKEYKISISPNLTPSQRIQLITLVYNYKDIFARDFSTRGYGHPDYELELETRDRRLKSYTRQYKLRSDEIDKIDKQITELDKI